MQLTKASKEGCPRTCIPGFMFSLCHYQAGYNADPPVHVVYSTVSFIKTVISIGLKVLGKTHKKISSSNRAGSHENANVLTCQLSSCFHQNQCVSPLLLCSAWFTAELLSTGRSFVSCPHTPGTQVGSRTCEQKTHCSL